MTIDLAHASMYAAPWIVMFAWSFFVSNASNGGNFPVPDDRWVFRFFGTFICLFLNLIVYLGYWTGRAKGFW